MSIQLDKVQPKNRVQLEQLIDYAFKHNIYDLNFIDTSKITDMCGLFEYIEHDFNVSKWDTSNVKNMSYMFYKCYKFTGKGIVNWDVSNVTNMWHLFDGCKRLDCDLSDWNVYKVTDMSYIFNNCEQFNCDLSHWNVSKVKDMTSMFSGCNKLTIPNWYK